MTTTTNLTRQQIASKINRVCMGGNDFNRMFTVINHSETEVSIVKSGYLTLKDAWEELYDRHGDNYAIVDYNMDGFGLGKCQCTIEITRAKGYYFQSIKEASDYVKSHYDQLG